jgi:hypothetical protein
MERIHRKSALTETSDLLHSAHEFGAELLWQRYEQQLPLCAFTGNGLNCRKCFQGPCRINPFGDEPSRGVCGADRDQIVMETLFQATLEGVLESARTLQVCDPGALDQELPDLAPGIPSRTAERLSAAGLLPVRRSDLFRVQNSFFSHRGYLSRTLKDLTRLGLIHYGFLRLGDASLAPVQVESAFDAQGINLLIVGQAPTGLTRALAPLAGRGANGRRINLLTSRTHPLASATAVADHGSPELLLGMNVDAVIVAPNASWPGLETLAATYGIPVVLTGEGKEIGEIAAEAIDRASRHAQRTFSGAASRTIRACTAGRGVVSQQFRELGQAFDAGRIRGVAVLFGEANAKQAFFERTLALMEAALVDRAIVLVGGDLGSEVDALTAELDRRQAGGLSTFTAELEKDGLSPISVVGSAFELPRVVSLLGAVPAVFAFPEFYRTSTWAGAVSLLSLGFTVQIGIGLPFWGSPWLAEALRTEWPQIAGGRLLAAPALPDARAQAEELVACLRVGRA